MRLWTFKIYKAEAKTQLDQNIKRLRSDRGGEYFSNEFDSFFVGIDFIVDKGNWIVNEMEDPVGTRMLYQTSSKNVVSDYVNEMILKYGLK